jgi:hypothetical protein
MLPKNHLNIYYPFLIRLKTTWKSLWDTFEKERTRMDAIDINTLLNFIEMVKKSIKAKPSALKEKLFVGKKNFFMNWTMG